MAIRDAACRLGVACLSCNAGSWSFFCGPFLRNLQPQPSVNVSKSKEASMTSRTGCPILAKQGWDCPNTAHDCAPNCGLKAIQDGCGPHNRLRRAARLSSKAIPRTGGPHLPGLQMWGSSGAGPLSNQKYRGLPHPLSPLLLERQSGNESLARSCTSNPYRDASSRTNGRHPEAEARMVELVGIRPFSGPQWIAPFEL